MKIIILIAALVILLGVALTLYCIVSVRTPYDMETDDREQEKFLVK